MEGGPGLQPADTEMAEAAQQPDQQQHHPQPTPQMAAGGMEIPATLSHGGRFIQYNIFGNIFEVTAKYRPPIMPIGKGAHGIVCSALNSETNEHVAIKKITNAFDNKIDAKRTLREIKLLRHMDHENRKLVSSEFSMKVLRHFSCSVFRRNSAKLARAIAELAVANRTFGMQVSKSDSWKSDQLKEFPDSDTKIPAFFIGYVDAMHSGFDIKSWVWDRFELHGLISKEGIAFMKAVDELNAFVYRRFVDPFWTLKFLLMFYNGHFLYNTMAEDLLFKQSAKDLIFA